MQQSCLGGLLPPEKYYKPAGEYVKPAGEYVVVQRSRVKWRRAVHQKSGFRILHLLKRIVRGTLTCLNRVVVLDTRRAHGDPRVLQEEFGVDVAQHLAVTLCRYDL